MTELFRAYDFKGILVLGSLAEKIDFFAISDSTDFPREAVGSREPVPVILDLSRVVRAFGGLEAAAYHMAEIDAG